ncbi:MAG: hypothetical protein IPM42_09940 [Saprospiraceae bacterium]|nr:hypothetical protein [Saprospiraceae bacterium]
MRLYNFILLFIFLSLMSCIDTDRETDFTTDGVEYKVAVPLVNSRISISKIAEQSSGKTSVRVDPDGKVTVLYNGDVIRRIASNLFPPFPGILDNPIPDTLYSLPLPFSSQFNTFLIQRATFRNTKIHFEFENDIPEEIKVKMQILNLQKNNKFFEQEYTIPYSGGSTSKLNTPLFDIDGWELVSDNNNITFYYEARRPNGEKIKLKNAILRFDVIVFSYIEGYLGYHIFQVDGSVINIGLFNNWISGGFNFEDPKIVLRVDNAFGLPVTSSVNRMDLTTISGNVVSLESPFINTGIDFAYPQLNEQGTIKSTYFTFDKTNSNIREIFNEKTKTISYDIDAIVNPHKDTTIKGFIDFDSYFNVNVAVEVPLNGYLNDLVIADTFDIKLSEYDYIQSAVFKVITANDFPIDITLQGYFLDTQGNVTDVLFDGNGIFIPKATLKPDGITFPGTEKTDFISFDKERYNKIRSSEKLVVTGKISSDNSQSGKSIWFYDQYGLTLKIGGIFDYKK